MNRQSNTLKVLVIGFTMIGFTIPPAAAVSKALDGASQTPKEFRCNSTKTLCVSAIAEVETICHWNWEQQSCAWYNYHIFHAVAWEPHGGTLYGAWVDWVATVQWSSGWVDEFDGHGGGGCYTPDYPGCQFERYVVIVKPWPECATDMSSSIVALDAVLGSAVSSRKSNPCDGG